MTEEQNPYLPAIAESESLVEQIRARSTWAAVLGALGLLVLGIVAPFAVYLGHQSLSRMRRTETGLEHRGAALTGTILGWLGSAILVISVTLELLAAFMS
ncbi:MAG TPA: DUF4190 domain-containing protein [Polyangiaceae bacterium]